MTGISNLLICNDKEFSCCVCGKKFVPEISNFHYHPCYDGEILHGRYACPDCIDNRGVCRSCGESVQPGVGCLAGITGSPSQQSATFATELADTAAEDTQPPTREDVENMLIKLYSSDVYNRLVARREHKAFLELFGKARLENGISSFLVWLFGNEQLNTIAIPPILHLLRLIAFKSLPEDENGIPKLEPELRDAILINRFQILNVEVKGEDINDNGRADIKITIAYRINDGNSKSNTSLSDSQKLILIIENKIDSTEGDNQCGRYEEHYTEEAKKDGSKVAFVFLSVIKPEVLTSEIFIKITHQDILDRVLHPLLVHSSQFSAEILRYIEAYIDNITSFNPDDKKPPIAMDESLRNLLIAFFDENESLIRAAIEAKKQTDSNYVGSLTKDVDSVSNGRRSTGTYKLIYINNDGESIETETFGMSKALLYYAQTMLELNPSLTNHLKDILPKNVFGKALITSSEYEQKKKEFLEKKENKNKKYHWYEPIAETDWYVHTGMWKLPKFEQLVTIVNEIGKEYEMEIVKC